jgi:hypothetical protein
MYFALCREKSIYTLISFLNARVEDEGARDYVVVDRVEETSLRDKAELMVCGVCGFVCATVMQSGWKRRF